ncbi:MAG: hypothetical protein HYV09_24035 [Deltaproteobacteria bacterium]|nr:hypothetical protein [Deltaproteobacteria bacterium]
MLPTSRLAAAWAALRARVVGAGATRRGVALLLGVGALLVLVGLRTPFATLAAVVLLAVVALETALVVAAPTVRRLRERPRLRTSLAWLRATTPVFALLAITIVYLRPAYHGEDGWLLNQDNPVHLERARLFFRALRGGHLPLWTNLIQGGEPLVDFYGWFGNFLPGAFRVLSLGKLDFEQAYEAAVGSLFTLTALATYALSRRFARRSISFGVALLPVIGGFYGTAYPLIGFWSWHLYWGVWPSLLALLLAVFATAKAIDVARRGRTCDVVATIALATAACLSHAFGLLALFLLQGSLGVALVLDRRLRKHLVPYAVAVGAAPALTAWWWLPSAKVMAAYGLRYTTHTTEGTAAYDVIAGPLTTYGLTAAALASFVAVIRGDRLLRPLAMAALAGILVNAGPFLSELGLVDGDTGKTMQWARMSFLFLFPASAAIAFFGERIARSTHRARPRAALEVERIARRAVVVFLAAMLAVPTFGRVIRDGRDRLLSGKPDRVILEREPFEALAKAIAARKERETTPFRVHYVPRYDGEHIVTLAVASGVPVVHTEYGGPIFLKNRMVNPSYEEERAWGARFVVVSHGDTRPKPWVLEERIGPFDLLRDPTNPGIVQPPPGVQVAVPVFRDDEIRLQVSGAPPEGADVRLAIAFYPRFKATQAGRTLTVMQVPALAGSTMMQMLVRVQNGEVVIRPSRMLTGAALGRDFSVLGAAAVVVFLLARAYPERARRLAERAGPLVRAAQRLRAWLASHERSVVPIALSALLGAIGARFVARPPAPETLQLGGLFGYRNAVVRVDRATTSSTTCKRSLITRDWTCASVNPKTPWRVAAVVSRTVTEGNFTPAWPVGAPWSGFRIEDREGAAEISVDLEGSCRKFLHPRVNGPGSVVQLHLVIGEKDYVIPWTAVSTIDLRDAPAAPATLRATFGMAANVSVRFECDDKPETPKLDDRTP